MTLHDLQAITILLFAVVYPPVSRIIAGGFSNGRPVAVAVLGVDLLWDDEQEIIWDDEQNIGWEA